MFRIGFILICLSLVNLSFTFKEYRFSEQSNLTQSKIKGRGLNKTEFCKCRTIRSRIINATAPFGEDDYPFLALIYINDYNSRILRSVCTGTIINEFHILTSASCIETLRRLMYNGWLPRAAAGKDHHATTILNDMNLDRAITGALKHPQYNPQAKDHLRDNIGIIQVEMPFEFGEKTGILPACLYEYKQGGQDEFRFEKDSNSKYRVILDSVGYGGNEYQFAINPQSALFRRESKYRASDMQNNYIKFRSQKNLKKYSSPSDKFRSQKNLTLYPSPSDKLSLVIGSARPWSIRLFQYIGKYCIKSVDRICTRMSSHAVIPPYDDYGSMCNGDSGSPLIYFDRENFQYKVIGILGSTNLADFTYNSTIKPLCTTEKVVNNYLFIGRYWNWIYQSIAKMMPSIAGDLCFN